MKISKIIVVITLLILSTNVLAIGRIPSLAEIFLGESAVKDDGGLNHLTKNIYSTAGVIDEQKSDIVQLIEVNAGDSDFINTLTHGRSAQASKVVPDSLKVKEIKGATCSSDPDYSKILNTKPTTLQLCFINHEKNDVAIRLWDMDADMKYNMDKPILKEKQVCFEAKPNKQYLYEVMYCRTDVCECSLFKNEYCEIKDGKLQMYRTRKCESSGCAYEQAWVDWIDTNAPNCNINSAFCRETDGGKDYMHYGKVYLKNEVKTDACISDVKILEYFCEDNEIKQQIRYCQDNQKCDNGECVPQPKTKKDCGMVDGELREHGFVWCDQYTLKNCTDGNVTQSFGHKLCTKPACDYDGLIVSVGQKVCLSDGLTIAECKIPNDVQAEFKYTSCPIDQECVPYTYQNTCKFVENKLPEAVQTEGINFWTWIRSFFGGLI